MLSGRFSERRYGVCGKNEAALRAPDMPPRAGAGVGVGEGLMVYRLSRSECEDMEARAKLRGQEVGRPPRARLVTAMKHVYYSAHQIKARAPDSPRTALLTFPLPNPTVYPTAHNVRTPCGSASSRSEGKDARAGARACAPLCDSRHSWCLQFHTMTKELTSVQNYHISVTDSNSAGDDDAVSFPSG